MRGEGSSGDSNHVLVAGTDAPGLQTDVPPTGNVLGVAYSAAAEAWLGQFQAGPERVAVVSVGEESRAAVSASPSPDAGTDVVASATGTVETVPDATDVAAVGTLVNDYLSAWADTGETTVVVDDLGAVLEHVSAETAFRFTHALLARASSMDATVVAGFDTTAQPPHVVDTFGELFDEVREGT